MQKIYHQHTSSNSYFDSSWTDSDWYLCDDEEEYQKVVADRKEQAKTYQNSENAKIYGAWRITCSDEQPLKANEYYYAHEWQGKSFNCVGVCFAKHLERSNHYEYIIKPNTVTNLKPCTDPGCGWMYGS